jgi:hypothetical protein
VGTQKIKGKRLESRSVTSDLKSFMEERDSGYFCVTVRGNHGLQEALMIVENGLLIGAHFEYLKFGKTFDADDALKRGLNSFFAPQGIYDSYELSVQQMELLKIFNEDMLFLEPKSIQTLEGMIPISYSTHFEAEVASQTEKNQEDLLEEHGLSQVNIDNYQQIQDQLKTPAKPPAPEKVGAGVEAYLSGKPIKEEPEEQPIVEEEKISKKILIGEKTKEEKEFTQLDNQAEKLLETMKKKEKK